MAATFMDIEKQRLVKRFHTLLGKASIDNYGKAEILSSYGVESTKDLSVNQLFEVCDNIDMMCNPAYRKMNTLRRRVMAAIGAYLRAIGEESNGNKIKAIACRAAQVEDFNKIPADRLQSLYNAFKNRNKDINYVDMLTLSLGNISTAYKS